MTHRDHLYKDINPQKSDTRNQSNKGPMERNEQTLFHPYIFSCD